VACPRCLGVPSRPPRLARQTTDSFSPTGNIPADANAWGEERNDEEYIVRLVKQVVTVSLETMKLLDALPKDYGGPPTVPLDAPGAARASFDLAPESGKPRKRGVKPLKLHGEAPARQRRLRD